MPSYNNERLIATALGHPRYFTGKPCANGHISERRTQDGICLVCAAARQQRFRGSSPAEREEMLEWKRANGEMWES